MRYQREAPTGFGVLGMGSYLPDDRVTSERLGGEHGIDPEWIKEKTGVLERRFAGPDESAAFMGAESVKRAVQEARSRGGLDRDEHPEMLIAATSTPDRIVPAPAYDVHALTGLGQIPVLNIDGGCAGFGQSLITALGFYRADMTRTAVVTGMHRSEAILDLNDRRVAPLFGDGAGAFVLGPVPAGYGILSTRMLTDSTEREAIRNAGKFGKTPADLTLQMNGHRLVEIFAQELPKMMAECLGEVGLTVADVDRFIVHQANVRMLEMFAALIGVDADRVPIAGDVTGNTASASLPITLQMSADQRPLERGDVVVLATAGAGLNGAVVVLRWY